VVLVVVAVVCVVVGVVVTTDVVVVGRVVFGVVVVSASPQAAGSVINRNVKDSNIIPSLLTFIICQYFLYLNFQIEIDSIFIKYESQ
jgi:hypothetical protein